MKSKSYDAWKTQSGDDDSRWEAYRLPVAKPETKKPPKKDKA